MVTFGKNDAYDDQPPLVVIDGVMSKNHVKLYG